MYRADAVRIPNTINVLIVQDHDGFTLVDCGIRGRSPDRIGEALVSFGAGPSDLQRVIVTRHHWDHVGGLQEIVA